jgi:hypothetical protein
MGVRPDSREAGHRDAGITGKTGEASAALRSHSAYLGERVPGATVAALSGPLGELRTADAAGINRFCFCHQPDLCTRPHPGSSTGSFDIIEKHPSVHTAEQLIGNRAGRGGDFIDRQTLTPQGDGIADTGFGMPAQIDADHVHGYTTG